MTMMMMMTGLARFMLTAAGGTTAGSNVMEILSVRPDDVQVRILQHGQRSAYALLLLFYVTAFLLLADRALTKMFRLTL
jgi:hypothetical protein